MKILFFTQIKISKCNTIIFLKYHIYLILVKVYNNKGNFIRNKLFIRKNLLSFFIIFALIKWIHKTLVGLRIKPLSNILKPSVVTKTCIWPKFPNYIMSFLHFQTEILESSFGVSVFQPYAEQPKDQSSSLNKISKNLLNRSV